MIEKANGCQVLMVGVFHLGQGSRYYQAERTATEFKSSRNIICDESQTKIHKPLWRMPAKEARSHSAWDWTCPKSSTSANWKGILEAGDLSNNTFPDMELSGSRSKDHSSYKQWRSFEYRTIVLWASPFSHMPDQNMSLVAARKTHFLTPSSLPMTRYIALLTPRDRHLLIHLNLASSPLRVIIFWPGIAAT